MSLMVNTSIQNRKEPPINGDSANKNLNNNIAQNHIVEQVYNPFQVSISKYIDTEYGIRIKTGNKGVCPFCGHKTFSIKKDDTLGKCFHPSCDKSLSITNISHIKDYKQEIINKLFNDFHVELLNQHLKKDYKNAYNWMIEREIHPQVIKDSKLGAIPHNYNVEKLFNDDLNKLNSDIAKYNSKLDSFSNSTARSAKQLEYKKNTLLKKKYEIEELKDKLESFFIKKTGDLVFFYTDEYHRITKIKTRKPYTKIFATCKINNHNQGVFNNGLFPTELNNQNEPSKNLIVTEGEFNQLQLQSLMANNNLSYVNSCSIGGVLGADFRTLKRISEHWHICYDNDREKAGYALVKNACEYNSFYAFTTPSIDSDLDDYIKGFKSDYNKALTAVKELLNNKKKFYRYYESIKKEINSIRDNEEKIKSHKLNQKVSDYITSELLSRAVFYYDKNYNYLFFEETNKLIQIEANNEDLKIILSEMGLNPSENLYKFVYEDIVKFCKKYGNEVTVRNFSYFDRKTFALYLYNNESKVYKITKDNIEAVKNGHDNVLFLYNNSYTPFNFVDGIDQEKDYFDDLIISKINLSDIDLSVKHQQTVLNYWFLSIFFKSIMSTKPLLTMIGVKGSGKTTYLRIIGKILFGPHFDVTPLPNNEKDFDTIVSNSPYIVFDNVDNYTPWLNDKLACISTGQTIKMRELFTTNKMVEFKTDCFVCLTSRTPQFTRDDIADRLLPCYVSRIEQYKSESEIISEIMTKRDLIMTSVMLKIQKAVKALYLTKDLAFTTNFRIADFAIFCLKYAHINDKDSMIKNILTDYTESQSDIAIEDDALVECLKIWLDKGNQNKEVDARQLYKEMSEAASENHVKDFSYKSPVGVAKKLNNIKENMKKHIKTEVRKGCNNKKYYKFSYNRPADPQVIQKQLIS